MFRTGSGHCVVLQCLVQNVAHGLCSKCSFAITDPEVYPLFQDSTASSPKVTASLSSTNSPVRMFVALLSLCWLNFRGFSFAGFFSFGMVGTRLRTCECLISRAKDVSATGLHPVRMPGPFRATIQALAGRFPIKQYPTP